MGADSEAALDSSAQTKVRRTDSQIHSLDHSTQEVRLEPTVSSGFARALHSVVPVEEGDKSTGQQMVSDETQEYFTLYCTFGQWGTGAMIFPLK